VGYRLVNVLVNTFQIGPHLFNGTVGIFPINGIIPPKHFIRAVTRDFHNDGLSYTRSSHVGVKAVPQIMEDKAVFLEAPVFYANLSGVQFTDVGS
jgi:hypothetical protein